MNPLEIAGFITGIAGVYLTIRENIWCFPTGLIYVIISTVLYYEQKLFADSLQQLVYIPLLTYGWWKWLKKEKTEEEKISHLSLQNGLILISITAIVSFISGWFFKTYTSAVFPWIDSAATACSFSAQWLIAKKKIENWYLWILVNIVYICIYINKDLNLYAILYFIYSLLALWGLKTWLQQLKNKPIEQII